MSLLKTAGVLVLVGFPSEVKFSPASLNIGILIICRFESFMKLKNSFSYCNCNELHSLTLLQV